MKKARSQKGSLCLSVNGSGTQVWIFRWWETSTDGRRVRRKRQVGTLDQYKTEGASAVRNWRLVLRANQDGAVSRITMKALIDHFREKELIDKGEDGRAWSTRDRYEAYLNSWIEPRWGKEELTAIRAPLVEEWLRNIRQRPRKRKRPQLVETKRESKPLAPASKAKIRNLMSVLFNHAIRWGFADRNPISGPNKGAGVRQSSKRVRVPDILEVSEMQAIVAKLQLRERVLLFLVMVTGLRRGELSGIQWGDIDFENLLIDVRRSVVDQVVGRCKTEASQKPVPIDEFTAQDLLAWYRVTPYREPADWVFASNSRRAGKNRGKAASLAADRHALSHRARRPRARHQQTRFVAHFPAHLHEPSPRQWRGCQGCAGTAAPWIGEGDSGCVRAGSDAGQAEGAAQGR